MVANPSSAWNICKRLLLDSRVVNLPRSSNLIPWVVLLCCRYCQAPVGIFFPFLFWGRCPLVQSRLAALVGTQLRLTHVLQPIRVQTQSIPLALFPPLT